MERSQRLYKLWRVQTNKREGKSQKSVIFGCLFLHCGISTRCKITCQGASGNSRCQISFTSTGHQGHCRHLGLSCPHHRSGCSRTALLRTLSALRRKSKYSPVATGRCYSADLACWADVCASCGRGTGLFILTLLCSSGSSAPKLQLEGPLP